MSLFGKYNLKNNRLDHFVAGSIAFYVSLKMRYFVYRNHRVTETGRIEYDHFLQNELNNFLFSPYSSIIDDKQLSIDALYYGVMSKEEANIPLPFKLFIYKDTAEIGKEGIDMKLTLDGIEHFSDFEKMAKRRKILIKEFEKN